MKTSRPLGILAALTLAASGTVALQGSSWAATCSADPNDPHDNVLVISNPDAVVPGQDVLVSGECFAPGQRLAVKIDRDAYGQLGADADEGAAEATRERIQVGPDGTFTDEVVTVPRFALTGAVTRAGSHTLHVLDNDPVTSSNATFTTVADFTARAAVSEDGTVTVSGTGWVNRSGAAASTVALQVEPLADGGAPVHHAAGHEADAARPFVWAYLVPSVDGTFSATVELPDGGTDGARGTATKLEAGQYVLRVRSGSGLAGAAADVTRSVKLTDAPFDLAPAADVVPVVSGVQVVGTATVGQKLTAKSSVAPAGAKVSYQWLRNGAAIAGATSASYAATPADVAKSLSVKVSAVNGDASASATSKAVKVAAASAKAGTVKITGKAKVGKTLSVKTAKWAAGTKLSYKWSVGGKTVKGATKSKLKVKKAWKGKKLTVKVTGTKAGFTTVTKSAKTATIKK